MKQNLFKKTVLSVALAVVVSASLTGCNKEVSKQAVESIVESAVESAAESAVESVAESVVESVADEVKDGAEVETVQVGEGSVKVLFEVVSADGTEKMFEVSTDEKTVGAALTKVELISGDESEYGLYVKTVDGETVDYDTDGSYWAFYVDGEYAQTGVDSTDITEGATYSFKVEK